MGFLFAISSALALSFQNSRFRKLPETNTFLLNWIRFVTAAAVLSFLVTVFSQWNIPPQPFWLLLLGITLPAEIIFAFCYVRAFQYSPQSLVGPLSSLTAIFLIPVAYFIIGEFPKPLGLVGIVSALAGGLLLGWDLQNPGIRKALAGIFRERGSYYILVAALAASITVSTTKLGYHYTSPLLFAFYIVFALAIVHTPVLLKYSLSGLRTQWRNTGMMAAAFSLSVTFHYAGLPFLLAAYFISVKRLSIVFDVIFGRIFGHEDRTRERLLGALLMVAGVILIALG